MEYNDALNQNLETNDPCCVENKYSMFQQINYVQLFDRTYSNILTRSGEYLNLSNEGIQPNYMNGNYTLTTTTTKNDTLNIAQPGLYKITLFMDTGFELSPSASSKNGTMFTLQYSLIDSKGQVLMKLMHKGIMPDDPKQTLPIQLSTNFMWHTDESTHLRLKLCYFNFENSLVNELNAYNIILMVERMPSI